MLNNLKNNNEDGLIPLNFMAYYEVTIIKIA